MVGGELKKCFLCDQEAILHEGYDTSGNIQVECDACKPYLVTDKAMRFYLDRPDGKKILDEDDFKKLSEYVNEKYKDKPVKISADLIKDITGKESVSYR